MEESENRRDFLTDAEASAAAPTPRSLGGVRAAMVEWMGRVPDSTDLRDMSIPGTHESCATCSCGSAGFAQCQCSGMNWLLTAGVRFFDIRCRPIDGVLAIHHGSIYMKQMFGDVVQACREFLRAHPSETLLMRVSREYDGSYQEMADIFYERYYTPNLFHASHEFPSLGQVRGKIVLMSTNGEMSNYTGRAGRFRCLKCNGSDFDIQDDWNNPSRDSKKNQIRDHFRKAVNAGPSRSKMFINYTSANGGGGTIWTPWKYAKELNPFTRSLLEDDYSPTARTGVIAMDYVDCPDGNWDAGDIDMISAAARMNPRRNQPISHGGSYIIWNKYTGMALDWYHKAQQWRYHGLPSERWTLTPDNNGRYSMRNENTGKYLESRSGKVAETTTPRYEWEFTERSDGQGHLIRNTYADKYLHMSYGSKEPGREVELDINKGYEWYTWYLDQRVDINSRTLRAHHLDAEFSLLQSPTDASDFYTAECKLLNTGADPIPAGWKLNVTLEPGVAIDTAYDGAHVSNRHETDCPDKGRTIEGEPVLCPTIVTLTGDRELPPGRPVPVRWSGRSGHITNPAPIDIGTSN